jgi:hypothetical protein
MRENGLRMRFYKFRRKRYEDPRKKQLIAQKKENYLIDKGKVRVLETSPYLFTENKTYGALGKAWMAYVISKDRLELPQMEYYARVIQKLQRELGLPIASFYELNLFPLNEEGLSQEDIDRYYDVEPASKQEMREW